MGQPKHVNLFSMCASWRCQTTTVQEQKQQQPWSLGVVNKDFKGNKFIEVSVRTPCQLWTSQASSPADQKAEKPPGCLQQPRKGERRCRSLHDRGQSRGSPGAPSPRGRGVEAPAQPPPPTQTPRGHPESPAHNSIFTAPGSLRGFRDVGFTLRPSRCRSLKPGWRLAAPCQPRNGKI